MTQIVVDAGKMVEADSYLNDAILKIDTLLRKYVFVTQIQLAREARLELEKASRLFHGEIERNLKPDSVGNVDEGSVDVCEGNDDIGEGNDVDDETGNESTENQEQEQGE